MREGLHKGIYWYLGFMAAQRGDATPMRRGAKPDDKANFEMGYAEGLARREPA